MTDFQKAGDTVKKRASSYSKKRRESKENDKNSKRESQGEIVVKLVTADEKIVLFHDQFNAGFLAPLGNGSIVFKIRSREARNWLNKIYWEAVKKPLNNNTLQSILQLLEARACFDYPEIKLYVRVAEEGGSIWYDLGEKAVRIAANGWEIVDDPPILFKRFPHQKKQVRPERGGKLEELLDFLNLKKGSKDKKINPEELLILCWFVFAFVPNSPHPVPVLNGPQGSKKTTFLNVIKDLIDPSSVSSQTSSNTIKDFFQTASHHWFLVFDNVTSLPWWLSDSISRVVTGAGFIKRELYTDDDDMTYNFKHIVGINGINLVVERADLLERSIILTLIRTKDFKTEKKFWIDFEKRKPYILGSVFSVLSKALKLLKETPEPKGEFRMADFAHWGSAIAKAFGFESKDFIEAYKTNISKQNEEAIDASPVGTAIVYFMSQSDADEWQGSPSELLSELDQIAEILHIKLSKSWPKDPRWLWKRISEVLPNLEEKGIKADRVKDKGRLIILKKIKKNDVHDVGDVQAGSRRQAPKDIKDNKDNISGKESSTSKQSILSNGELKGDINLIPGLENYER